MVCLREPLTSFISQRPMRSYPVWTESTGKNESLAL